jgi:hypothetical protein
MRGRRRSDHASHAKLGSGIVKLNRPWSYLGWRGGRWRKYAAFCPHVSSVQILKARARAALVPVLEDVKRPSLPLSLVRTSAGYLPLKLGSFLDFGTPRLKMRLSASAKNFLVNLGKF